MRARIGARIEHMQHSDVLRLECRRQRHHDVLMVQRGDDAVFGVVRSGNSVSSDAFIR